MPLLLTVARLELLEVQVMGRSVSTAFAAPRVVAVSASVAPTSRAAVLCDSVTVGG